MGQRAFLTLLYDLDHKGAGESIQVGVEPVPVLDKDALEKEMATHSSVLAWRIPGTGEPGGLPSMGSHRVRHN